MNEFLAKERIREGARESLTFALAALYDRDDTGTIAALGHSIVAVIRISKLCTEHHFQKLLEHVHGRDL